METYTSHPLKGATDLDSSMNMLWEFYKKHFVVLYAISVIAALASSFITSGIDLTALQSTKDPMEMLAIYKEMAVPYLLLLLVSVVFSIIMSAYILDKPVEEQYSFMGSLKKSAVALFPYLCAIIIIGFTGVMLISLGLVLLVLPGIFAAFYLLTVYFFTVPVALIESRNPGFIITRSLHLTHKNLWRNIGWSSVIILIILIVAVVISTLSALPFTGTLIKSISDPAAGVEMSKNPVHIIISSLTGALITPVIPIMAFILYFRNAENIKPVTTAENYEGPVRVEDLYPKMPERD